MSVATVGPDPSQGQPLWCNTRNSYSESRIPILMLANLKARVLIYAVIISTSVSMREAPAFIDDALRATKRACRISDAAVAYHWRSPAHKFQQGFSLWGDPLAGFQQQSRIRLNVKLRCGFDLLLTDVSRRKQAPKRTAVFSHHQIHDRIPCRRPGTCMCRACWFQLSAVEMIGIVLQYSPTKDVRYVTRCLNCRYSERSSSERNLAVSV